MYVRVLFLFCRIIIYMNMSNPLRIKRIADWNKIGNEPKIHALNWNPIVHALFNLDVRFNMIHTTGHFLWLKSFHQLKGTLNKTHTDQVKKFVAYWNVAILLCIWTTSEINHYIYHTWQTSKQDKCLWSSRVYELRLTVLLDNLEAMLVC